MARWLDWKWKQPTLLSVETATPFLMTPSNDNVLRNYNKEIFHQRGTFSMISKRLTCHPKLKNVPETGLDHSVSETYPSHVESVPILCHLLISEPPPSWWLDIPAHAVILLNRSVLVRLVILSKQVWKYWKKIWGITQGESTPSPLQKKRDKRSPTHCAQKKG